MFADIVGYTALMQHDEPRALAARRAYRLALDREVSKVGGQTVQHYGDGALCLFPSAISAVSCAVEMQRTLREEPKVDVRIGIHSGEVVIDDDGAYGDAVNIASRIESLSVPGSVFVSDKVYDEIKNQPDIRVLALGHRTLKNVTRPVEVYAIDDRGIVVPATAETKPLPAESGLPSAIAARSVAVLPFVNMSADPENEYFSDGITEEIISTLTRVPELRVTSRTSSFAFKGKNTDVREIASRLHVEHVLEGSVRRAGSRVRITAQLIYADDGFHLFSKVYDRELDDIFAIQDEIAERIADELTRTVGGPTPVTHSVDRTIPIEAYTLYLKGRHHYGRWTPESVKNSIEFYRQAVRIAPDYSTAYAGLAASHSFLAAIGRGGYSEAREAAERALALDPTSAESHQALGMVAIFADWDGQAAEEHLTKAVQLSPGLAEAHYALSLYHMFSCNAEAALAQGLIALELDPLSLPVLLQVGTVLALDGDIEAGNALIDRALDIDPSFRGGHEWKGWIHVELSNYEEAIDAFRTYARLSPNPYAGAWPLGVAYARMGDYDKARAQLERLYEREQVEREVLLHQDIAAVLASMGAVEAAMDRLERAVEAHQGGLVFLKMSPVWKPVSDHPRFQAILDRIGFWKNTDD